MKLKLVYAALVALVLLALPSTASAQLASNEVYVNTPFKIAANHDGVNTTDYRLYRNTVLVNSVAVTALVAGVVTIDSPGLSAGTYAFQVEAKGDGGAAKSTVYSVVVKALPAAPVAPSGLRLIVP